MHKAHRGVVRVAIVADEILLEDDDVLFPQALRVLCLKVQGLAPLTWLSLLIDRRPVGPAQQFPMFMACRAEHALCGITLCS